MRRGSYPCADRPYTSLPGVEDLVDQAVGELVLLARDVHVADARKRPAEAGGFERERTETLVLDAVFAAHLLHHQLGVGADLELGHTLLDGALQTGDQAAVL